MHGLFDLKRYNSSQNQNNSKATHQAPRPLKIFKVLKFSGI